MAVDLTRFLRDEPIRARPIGRREEFHRWMRSHPVIAVLLIAVALISIASAARLRRANIAGQEKLREAYLSQARANRWSGRPGRRFESLDVINKAAAFRPSIELRNEAIAALALSDIRPLRTWEIADGTGWGFDERLSFYSRGEGAAAVVSHTEDGTEVARVTESGATNCYYSSISGDGHFLLAAFKKDGGTSCRSSTFAREKP